jgi:hypothetical protein
MKKEKLVWRLGKLPTVSELKELVDSKIITNEEAREILLNHEEISERDIKSYQEEIKFLRELVEKMSQNQKTIEIIKQIEIPYVKKDWYYPYIVWNDRTSKYYCSGTSNITLLNSNTDNVGSNFGTQCSFSSIKTF